MTSRDDDADDTAARLQATIDRLALELAQTRRELAEAQQALAETEARERTWRRVAQWIHEARLHPEE